MKALALFLILLAPIFAAPVYVSQAGNGAHNGTSLANAYSAAEFNTASNWSGGGNAIDPGDVVYLSGTFTTRLAIQGSGTSAAIAGRITLTSEPSTPATLVGINIAAFDYIAIIGLNFYQTSTANNYPMVAAAGTVGSLLHGNVFDNSYVDAINFSSSGNNQNIIRKNHFDNIGAIGNGAAGGNSGTSLISLVGNANLIEYNTSNKSMDRVRIFGTGNVVWHNYWGPTDTTYYPSSSPYPIHTDGLQSYEGSLPLVQILYAYNYDTDNRDTVGGATNSPNGHGFLVQDGGLNGFNWFVIRGNIMIREAETSMLFHNITDVFVFNNTIVNIGYDKTTEFNNAIVSELPGTTNADFRNNTFPYNQKMRDAGGIIYNANWTNFTSAANHSYNPSGQQVVLPTGASPANLAQTAPQFTNGAGTPGNDDYTLTSGSPLRAASAPITLANGAGTSTTTLVVASAKRLFDGKAASGWPETDADWIKIGSGAYVQISSINYGTNTVTLSQARTFLNNDPVYILGTEDLGALPFGTTKPSGRYTNVGNNYTTTTAGDVRMVIYSEDGIPQAPAFVAPYTYTSNGGIVTVDIYAAYAAANPVVAATVGTASLRSAKLPLKAITVTLP